MKKIVGSANIENFVRNDYIYVDKTRYIHDLIESHELVFFSRPRRFGKSLTLDIIGTLFEKGVDPYLKGTWIDGHWSQPTYPVLHLSFLEYPKNNVENLRVRLSQDLSDFATRVGLPLAVKSQDPIRALKELFNALGERQIVILIDEYDCQLTANINQPELYTAYQSCLREFYGMLKGKKQISFLAVTGVTMLKDISIFSVGSDIQDLSYEPSFSQMIGFTRGEIKTCYLDYLKLGVCCGKHKAE